MRRVPLLAMLIAIAGLLAFASAALADATQLSSAPIPEDSHWRDYVLDQYGGVVYPKHVYLVAGDTSQVSNPQGLAAPGGGVTTIRATGQGVPRLELDLGINTGGYVEVGITKSDGTTVHLGYSEARRLLTPDGDLTGDPTSGNDDDPGSRSDDFTTVGDSRSPGIRGSQRWISLQLQNAGTVSIDYVRVREEHLLPKVSDYVGHFLSNDDQLNRVWYAGVHTFADVAVKDLRPGHTQGHMVVVDGGKRDRLVWIGDVVVEDMLGNYALRGAPQIMRDSIQIFSCQQGTDGLIAYASQIDVVCPDNPPTPTTDNAAFIGPSYTAAWVAALHDFYMYTGDGAFATRMLPVARRAMDYFEANLDPKGLYAKGPFNYHPYDPAVGEDTWTNAYIYLALKDLAELERWVGDGGAAASARDAQAAAMRQAMLTFLWDPVAQAFWVSGTDPQVTNHSLDAQVWPIYSGVITGDQAASALRFVDQNLYTRYGTMQSQSDADPWMSNYISPFIGGTELLARLQYHDAAGALDLMRREWGHMVDTDPNTTLWEKMNLKGDAATYAPLQLGEGVVPNTSGFGAGFDSLAHGWSGDPIPALSGYVLGIRPASPGYAAWTVEPQSGGLLFAQGQAPTPHGPIVSRWKRGADNSSFVLTVKAPAGTSGEVAVPLLGEDRVIAKDGKVVWDGTGAVGGATAKQDSDQVRFSHVTGSHTFAWAN